MSTAATNAGPTPGQTRPTAPPPLFDRLVDDAAIFPPGNAALPAAVGQHRALRTGELSAFVGPFLCTASRLDELRLVLDDEPGDEPPLDLAVVVDTGAAGLDAVATTVGADDRLDLHAVEIALGGDRDLGVAARRVATAILDAGLPQTTSRPLAYLAGPPGQAACAVGYQPLGCYVEVPRAPTARDALEVLAQYELRAKLRTGGADAAAFPDEHEVAAFLDACLDLELVIKCTAGLHHAVRHTDPATGFEHQGFLNVLLATHVLLDGGSVDDAVVVLAERDGVVLAGHAVALSVDEALRVRRSFASYGSCSVTEPVDDLVALGLVGT